MPPLKQSGKPFNGPKRHISFYGENFNNPSENTNFDVLAGDTPPTITGGYAKWQTIDRPLRRGVTVFQGYDPPTMSVAIRFMRFDANGSWLTDTPNGLLIEEGVEILEFMAGWPGREGPPMLVWLSTYDGRGNAIPLIPFNWQPASSPNVPAQLQGTDQPWVITGLEWDQNPLRNHDGYRTKQDATVTVQRFSQTTDTPFDRTQPANRGKSSTFVSRPGADTAITIARTVHSRDASVLAAAIKAFPQNAKLHIRSIYHTRIKHGKKVHIPVSYG